MQSWDLRNTMFVNLVSNKIKGDYMIYIVVPTFNRVEICHHFIEDLRKQTYQDYYLVLVDHGKRKADVADTDKIKVLNSDVNGWAKAVNIGLRYILDNIVTQENDHILIINDDVILPIDYLESIVVSCEQKPKAILGTCCIDRNTKKTLRVAIKLNKVKAKHLYLYQNIDENDLPTGYIESDVLTGKGTVIPISIIKDIGIYNEEKLPHYKADHELIWRAKKAGYDVYASTAMKLYTFSDQKTASGKESLKQTIKFFYFDMRSTIKIKDWWNYAVLAYSKPYAIYFFLLNFARNTAGMMIEYIRTR